MLPGPFIIRECPECKKTFRQMTMSSGNTFGAKLWSDTKFDAPMLMESHRCAVCPECDTPIWIEESVEVDKIKWEEIEESKYSNLESYKTPTIGNYLEMLNRKDLNKADETYLRLQLLYCYNDHFRWGMPESTTAVDNKKNKLRLIELLGNDEDGRLLKAELHRELGEFDAALALLEDEFDTNHLSFADKLRKLCLDKITDVVVLE